MFSTDPLPLPPSPKSWNLNFFMNLISEQNTPETNSEPRNSNSNGDDCVQPPVDDAPKETSEIREELATNFVQKKADIYENVAKDETKFENTVEKKE